MARDDIQISPKAFIALFFGVLASLGYTTYGTRQDVVRPDPFTGTEGRALQSKIESLEKQVEWLQKHGPDGVRNEIETLKRRLDDCMNQGMR